jgi:hypothetical protein
MWVLDYTIIAANKPYLGRGTDHHDALMNFISKPGHWLANGGAYEAQNGEEFHVIGVEQQAYADWMVHNSIGTNLRESAARGGKGSQDAKRNYAAWQERDRTVEQPKPVAKTFVLRERTVFDAEEIGTPSQVTA